MTQFFSTFRAALAIACMLLVPISASADGTDELMPDIGTDDYRLGLRSGTEVFVEISNIAHVICVEAGGSATVDVQGPYTNDALPGPFLTGGDDFDPNGGCLTPTSAGIYRIVLAGSFSSSSRWDISVCDSSAPFAICDASAGNIDHIDGRVYSFEWLFRSSNNQTPDSVLSSSFYARTTLNDGSNVGSGVIQLQLLGFNGLAAWEVMANDSGVDGVSPSKSIETSGNSVTGQYPIYLIEPDEDFREYSTATPTVTGFAFDAGAGMQMCSTIEPGANTGDFSFKTTFDGRYRIICDLDDDGNFETIGGDDLILSGNASAAGPMGTTVNEVTWDGKDNSGADVSAGDYDCMATVSVGEFHYVARDMEVGFEGIRMFTVGSGPANTRTGINMFWDDTDVFPAIPIAMNNGTFPAPTSPAIGLAPGNDPNAAAVPYGLDSMGMTVAGNSRGWGSFLDPCPIVGSCSTNGNGDVGDDDYMDTWASFASAGSTSLSVSVLGSGANCDGDARTDQQETCIDGTNPCGCTNAGTATPSSPDTECTMATPACSITMGVGICVACIDTATLGSIDEGCVMGSAQVCDDTGTAKCVPCYDDETGSDDSCGGSGAALSVCKVDGMDTADNECVECVADSDCSMGEVCNSTTDECEVPPDCTSSAMCSGATPVCDTGDEVCVVCIDSDDTNAVADDGCSIAATPHCDTSSNASGKCVECSMDSDCDTGDMCDTATNTCVAVVLPCTDNSECADGICDTAGGECVTCLDSGLGVDSGCSGATPVCEDVSGVLTCVAGTTNAGGGISGGALCAFSGAPSNGLPLGIALACLVWGWTRRQRR